MYFDLNNPKLGGFQLALPVLPMSVRVCFIASTNLRRVSLSSWHSKAGNKINRMMIEREKQIWGFKRGIVQLKLWY